MPWVDGVRGAEGKSDGSASIWRHSRCVEDECAAGSLRSHGDSGRKHPHLRYSRLMHTYRVARAAQLLGVSDDTVRRWIEQGLLPTTDSSPAEIPGDALAAHTLAMAAAAEASGEARTSARNRFTGLVTRVQIDGLMAQVDIQAGPHRVVSLMSAEAARELQLEVGALATASVKATQVVVEIPKD